MWVGMVMARKLKRTANVNAIHQLVGDLAVDCLERFLGRFDGGFAVADGRGEGGALQGGSGASRRQAPGDGGGS
jgi:hypothetical protein